MPVDLAKSLTCLGLTTATGRLAAANAAISVRPYPPVASSTTSAGCEASSRDTRPSMPSSSLGMRHRSPVGRTATSRWVLATSMPTYTSAIALPSSRPILARCGLACPGNCSGSMETGARRPELFYGLTGPRGLRPVAPVWSSISTRIRYKGEQRLARIRRIAGNRARSGILWSRGRASRSTY